MLVKSVIKVMNNIFKDAYFGKAYKTGDGRKAIYIQACHNDGEFHNELVVSEISGRKFGLYRDDGSFYTKESHENIVSEWQEEINEEELDRLARIEGAKAINHFVNREQPKFAFEGADLVSGAFKAGYYKASEHFLSVENIRKVCHLITDWTEQIMLGEKLSPLAQEYLTRRDELLEIENYGERTEKMAELYNKYEARFISENLSYE